MIIITPRLKAALCNEGAGNNPFSFDFNFESLKSSIDWNEDETALLEIINTLHRLFLSGHAETYALMSSSSFSMEEIFEELMVMGNRHILLLFQRMESVYANSTGKLDFERLREIEVENGMGQSENVQNSAEILIDLYSMLISYQQSFGWLNVVPDDRTADNGLSREEVVQRLVLYINIVFNARIAFQTIVYSGVEVSRDEHGTINLGPDPDRLSWITAANEIRAMGRFNELYLPTTLIKDRRKKKAKTIASSLVKDDQFSLVLKEEDLDVLDDIELICQIEVFYPHLEELRLSGFKDVMFLDLLKLLNRLSSIVHFFRQDYANKDLMAVNPPYRIRKDALYEYLADTANLGKDIVATFVDSLIDKENPGTDLYRYPILEEDEFIVLCFPAINSPKPHPFVFRWLEASGIKEAEERILFRDFVKQDLEYHRSKQKPKIKWKVLDSAKYPELLAVETRDFFIVLDFICPKYTVNQAEERKALIEYDQIYSDRAQLVSEFSDEMNVNRKRLLKVCITSDIHYSGLKIADIPILDIVLFKNYMIVGRYQKVKMIRGEQGGAIKDVFDLPYYLNEDEFEAGIFGFMDLPIPIAVLTSKMKPKLIPIFPEKMEFSVQQTVSQLISEQEEEVLDLSDLDGMLKTQYFLNENNTHANRMINSLISKLFSHVADTQRNDLSVVEELMSSIKTSKRISSEHLVAYLGMMMMRMKHIQMIPDSEFVRVPYENDKVQQLLDKCISHDKATNLQLSSFQLDAQISEDERRQLLSFLCDNFTSLVYRDFDDNHLKSLYMQLILLGGLVKDGPEFNAFFLIAGNFVENLNLNQHYQTARDVAQEIWIFAVRGARHVQGLNVLFKCYIKQKNILYAAVYGGILMAAADSLYRIEKALYVDILYNLTRFFRDFGYAELAKMAWKSSRTIKLDVYDDQKFTLAYFNARLSIGIKLDKELQAAVAKYLRKNYDGILRFGDLAMGPWLGLCMNIRRHCGLHGLVPNPQLIGIIEKLEKNIEDKAIIENLKYQVEGVSTDLKEQYTQTLEKVFDDQYFEDFKYDVGNLKPISDNVFLAALASSDKNLLLSTSFVYNDQRLSFVDVHAESNLKVFGKKTRGKLDLENYFDNLCNGLTLSDRQILVWLLELNGNVYRVVITSKGLLDVKYLEKWKPSAMNQWIREVLPRFYFNSQKNRYYDFAEQENVSNELIKTLASYDLLVDEPFSEILMLKSIDMSSYPDNLLINHGKLISSSIPICNILNFEHYIANHERIDLQLRNINAWFPVEGGDATINFGDNEMGPLLEENGAKIIHEKQIDEMPDGELNIFLAHGTTDLDGFKYFQADDNSFHYRTDIFGKGTIAILFICSSGNLHEDFQSQDVKAIGQDLIIQGYSAVIAPFWKYDVTMARIWLTEFFKVFKEGYSLMESVHLSNRKVTEYDELTQRMFVEPAGWAAMHLYGNPNIYYGVAQKP